MQIKITAETNGKEIIEGHVIPTLAANKVAAEAKDVKVQVQTKANDWVEVAPEKVKFSYGKT